MSSPREHSRRPGPPGGRFWQLLPIDWGRVAEFTNEPVPAHIKRWWFALGGTPAYLFFIQVTTGLLLTFYYVPHPDHAYESVQAISRTVPFGWFVRSIHKWSGNLMIVTVLLHLCRVFFTAAYRHPRQLNWVVGLGLLACTLTFGFTGYSLIYEQLSFWGATVAGNLTATVPLVGGVLAAFLRGGPEVGPNTLTRLYMLHVALLPIAMVVLIALHIALIRLHGISELSFEDRPTEPRPPRPRRLGVHLFMAGILALVAAAALVAAVRNASPVDLISYQFSHRSRMPLNLAPGHWRLSDLWAEVTSARLLWLVLGLAAGTGMVLLWRRHLYGLWIYLTVAVLGSARLAYDLATGRSEDPSLSAAVLAILTAGALGGLWRHRQFTEPAPESTHFNFFPDHILTEVIIGTGLLFGLVLLTLVFPAGLAEKANPAVTPEHIKPEWYFFFQFRLLKLTSLNASVLLTGLLLLVLVAWPLVDRLLEKLAPGRDLHVYIGVVAFLAFLALTVWEATA